MGFRICDRDEDVLMPPSIQDWVSADDGLEPWYTEGEHFTSGRWGCLTALHGHALERSPIR